MDPRDASPMLMPRILQGFAVSVVCLALACVSLAEEGPAKVLIKDVPHVRQKQDFCGEACVEMVLKKLGFRMDQDYVFDISGVDPLFARGCYARELARAMQKMGFEPGHIWYSLDPAGTGIEAPWKSLQEDLAKGIPSIVCMHYSDQPNATEHFRLILGYDPGSEEVIYNEPAVDKGGYLRMKRNLFLKLWPLNATQDNPKVIRLRCEAKSVTNAVLSAGFTSADYAQHMILLKEKLAGRVFFKIVEPPFVVIGDEDPDQVRLHSERTIRWAVTKLKADYFAKDPDEIIDVFLFKDKSSYETNTLALFNEEPTTPYGFYSAENHAIVMNIGTGGGTLVHEIVHSFMHVNFTNCPTWFNEGLGSLYEKPFERAGHISGHINWRLPDLQKEIAAESLPSFPELLKTTSSEFYGSSRGNNYAQARYLCYYLQEKGLLLKFYREFTANSEKDPSGLESLKKVLGENDMAAFKKKWEKFVLKL